MSVAVGHALPYGDNLARMVIRTLVARDEEARIDVIVDPGVLVESTQIRRHPTGYCVEFRAGSHQLRCPLPLFQARTELVVWTAANDTRPARPATAKMKA